MKFSSEIDQNPARYQTVLYVVSQTRMTAQIILLFRSLLLLIHFGLLCTSATEFSIDSGGWVSDGESLILDAGPCNIEVRNGSMTQGEFLSNYAYFEPVVIRGASDNSEFQEMCRKDRMLDKFGEKVITLSSANTYSYTKVDVTLEQYVSNYLKPQKLDQFGNETLYWFGDNNYAEWNELFRKYHAPKYYLPRLTAAYSFGVAGAGTGVPFHFHGPGFAEVVFGRKRWFMYPPHRRPRFNPNVTTLQWLLEDYPKLSGPELPYECTINPGEVIYFPDHWWHGTLNLDASVFISTFLG
ncbi:hypothetical protein LSH36_217g02002 [Paralvinella palmiformis]|uniref:JmjC domain-containing protein n=1 Tax=Paralvinella palmiformis TaxID=53620 RepID=A0AAD9N6U2_9ANNE|nr:hypothetical protein LSH36_217g02002 [Paralvinella palmiformis]